MDKSTSKSRGNGDKSTALAPVEGAGLPTSQNVVGVYKANDKRRAEVLARGRMNRKIVTMEEGDVIEGRLIGEGAPLSVKTPDGEDSLVKTWNFDLGAGVTVGILGSHQLDSELPPYFGRNMYVERCGTRSTGKRRVTEWLIVDLDAGASSAPTAEA